MEISFHGSRDLNYPPGSLIARLSDFILINKGYFEVFCNISITAKREEFREDNINFCIQEGLIQRSISPNKVDEFKILIQEYYNNFQSINNLSGKFVEYLIKKISPLKIPRTNYETLYHAKVLYRGNPIDEKNFDLINYIDNEVKVAELIECKLDIDSFLYQSTSKKCPPYKGKALEKMHFMCEALVCVSEEFDTYVIFATLRKNLRSAYATFALLGFNNFVIMGENELLGFIA